MRGASPHAVLLVFILLPMIMPGGCAAAGAVAVTPQESPAGSLESLDHSLPLPNVTFARETLGAQDWYEQGFALTNEGQYGDAILAYGKALSLNRSLLNAWYYTGDALFRLGRYSEAILAFENATAVDPDFVEAYFYESMVYGKLGRSRDEEDTLRKGLDAADRKKAAEENQTAVPAGGPGSLPEPLLPVIAPLGIALAMGLWSLRRQEPDS